MSAEETKMPSEWERHVSRRCWRMDAHNGPSPAPIPCEHCYSVEAVWRSVPYEPDSRSSGTSPVSALLSDEEAMVGVIKESLYEWRHLPAESLPGFVWADLRAHLLGEPTNDR